MAVYGQQQPTAGRIVSSIPGDLDENNKLLRPRSGARRLGLLAGPRPFDPGAECPKVAYCGQCASHGACAWCGDPGDSSKGQCVAVGHSECSAPSTWSKTPDHCPAPPPDAVASSTTEPAATSSSPAKEAVGPEKFAAIKHALSRAFPQANVTDSVVAGIVEVLVQRRSLGPGGGLKAEQREAAPITKHVQEKEHRLYFGDATHHRVKAMPPAQQPMQSEFTVPLPMVRVTLPETLDASALTIATEIGDVDLGKDHLLGSVDLIHAKYGGAPYLGYRPGRVDLITPARFAGGRFAAMALYLGYRHKADRAPSFYLLEAGTATGTPRWFTSRRT